MRKHHKITFAVLALLAALPFFVQADRPEPPLQPTRAEPQAVAPQTEAPLTLTAALPVRPEMSDFRGNPFSLASAKPRPAARDALAAGPKSAAPENPYRFAGEVRRPGATHRFLVRGNDILEVKPGDVLGEGYRVDAVDEAQVVLVHLASGYRHVIALSVPAATLATTPAPMAAAPAPMAAAPVPTEAAPAATVPSTAAAPVQAGTTRSAPALLIGGSATGVPPKALRKS